MLKYRGETGYYVCSDDWTSAFSDALCGQLGYSYVFTYLGPNSTWLDSTRLDSTRSTLSSQSSQSRRACRARRAALFQYGERRTSYSVRLHKFIRFYALAYTNPICFVK